MTTRLIKFGSRSCSACKAMDAAKTLERFVAKHPEVTLVKLDVADERGDQPKGSAFETNYAISDDYDVDTLPTLIFETEDGGELASVEGGVPMHELEKVYVRALARVEASKKVKAQTP